MNKENQTITAEKLGLVIQSVNKIKLTKNTKGYNWEIQLISHDIDELVKIDNKLIEKFGGEE